MSLCEWEGTFEYKFRGIYNVQLEYLFQKKKNKEKPRLSILHITGPVTQA